MRDESILIVGLETGREFGEDTYGLTACKELLQDKGFINVQVANNLELALNAIATYTPKVILLEYHASSRMLTEVASHKGTAHLLIFSKYNNYDIGMVYDRMPHVNRLIKFVEAGVIDYIDGIQDLNLDDMTRIPLPDALIKAIGQALTQESPLVLPPIISKVLYTFGRVELAHSELHKRAKLDVYEHYYMPGDLVYFKERRYMAFCSIEEIIRRKEDPRRTEFVLKILKQPNNHNFFMPLLTLRKHLMIDRTPELSGVSGTWQFYTPEAFARHYGSYDVKMIEHSTYRKRIIGYVLLVVASLALLLGGCALLATRIW